MKRLLAPIPIAVLAVVVALVALLAYGLASNEPNRKVERALGAGGREQAPEVELPKLDGGGAASLADYRGKVVVLTFGFTRCPDVCPMTLATLKRAVGRLGPEGGQVQVLFVTLDPARDTGPVMRTYLDAFDPSFVGLRGNRRAVARTALDFRVFYKQAKAGSSANDYVIDHTLGSYVFDREGKPRVFVANDKIDLLVSDIRSLLHGPAVAQAPQTWR